MSVLITGVNMPSFGEGNELIVRVLPNGAVLDEHGIYLNAKAVPVPKHGRLIDADALLEWANADLRFGDPDFHAGLWHTVCAIEDAPTIIPASEEGET